MRVPAAAVLVALIAVALAGCSLLPPPAGIQLTIPATGEVRALPVTVVDHAGIVRDAAPGELPDEGPGGVGPGTSVQAVPGRDDAVLVTWVGGSCDDRAIVAIDETGGRYAVTVRTESSATGCDAAGRFRAVLLSLVGPVAPDAFEAP
jgi:hypothetical protein